MIIPIVRFQDIIVRDYVATRRKVAPMYLSGNAEVGREM
jgi:hypothetical protein